LVHRRSDHDERHGPLFFWLWSGFSRALPHIEPLLAGRILAFACACGICALTGIIVFRRTGSVICAGIPALGFLAAFQSSNWLSYSRVDALASCLVVAAYLAVEDSAPRVLAAAGALVLASLAKQTAGLHAVPLLAFTSATYGSRRAREFTFSVAILGLALWLPIWTSNERFFWYATIGVHITPWNIRAGSGLVYAYFVTPVSVTALYACWFRIARLQHTVLTDKWTVGFLWALLAASVFCLKPGSTVAYFMDAAWLGAVLIALQAAHARDSHPALLFGGVAAAACLLCIPVVHELKRQSFHPASHRRELVRAAAGQGDVIADGYLVPYVVEARGSLLVSDPFLFTRLVHNGRISDAEVVRRLSDGATAIFFRPLEWHRSFAEFWPASVIDLLERDYCLASTGEEVFVYRPRWTHACGGAGQRNPER